MCVMFLYKQTFGAEKLVNYTETTLSRGLLQNLEKIKYCQNTQFTKPRALNLFSHFPFSLYIIFSIAV